MSYDSWKTTTPADQGHMDECNCEECHEWHVKNGRVPEYSKTPDYECCQMAMEDWIHQGKWCLECDSDAYINDGLCHNIHKDGKVHNLKAA